MSIFSSQIFKGLFSEPNSDKYKLDDDLCIVLDASWTPSSQDAKSLSQDFENVRKDFGKSWLRYRKTRHGKTKN